MAYNFVSPGAAAASSFTDAIMRELALRRQAQLDQLNAANINSEIQDRAMNRKIQQGNLDAQQEERDALTQARRAAAAKDAAAVLSPGQDLTPDTTDVLKKGGYGALVLAGPTAYGSLPPSEGEGPTMTQEPDKYTGTAAQIDKQTHEKQLDEYIKGLDPNSPEAKALAYERMTGKSAPAGMFEKPDKPTTDVADYEYYTKQEQAAGRTPKTFEQFMTAKHPQPDHSLQQDNRLDRSYQFNSTQLEKFAAPIEERAVRMQRLVRTLNENNPQADALVAPELVTIMAGGQGSGLRVNEAELQRIVGGRNAWQNLKSAVDRWNLDPSKPFLITPEQRTQVKALIGKVGEDLGGQLDAIDQGRTDLINAPSVEEHRRVVARVKSTVGPAAKSAVQDNTNGSTNSTGSGSFKVVGSRPAGK